MRDISIAWNEKSPAITWRARIGLGLVAIVGSAAYAASFVLFGDRSQLVALAIPIAIAAGVSWLAFGGGLLVVTRRRPSGLAWADACLSTMAIGIGVLLLSVVLNALHRGTTGLHTMVLVASNAAMLLSFLPRARGLGMSTVMGVALWVGALDGSFLLLVWWLS